jgi:hypothetical protein
MLFLENSDIPKLKDGDKLFCDSLLSTEECGKALKEL